MTTITVFKKDTTWQQLLARHMNCNVKSINNILYTLLKNAPQQVRPTTNNNRSNSSFTWSLCWFTAK